MICEFNKNVPTFTFLIECVRKNVVYQGLCCITESCWLGYKWKKSIWSNKVVEVSALVVVFILEQVNIEVSSYINLFFFLCLVLQKFLLCSLKNLQDFCSVGDGKCSQLIYFCPSWLWFQSRQIQTPCFVFLGHLVQNDHIVCVLGHTRRNASPATISHSTRLSLKLNNFCGVEIL